MKSLSFFVALLITAICYADCEYEGKSLTGAKLSDILTKSLDSECPSIDVLLEKENSDEILKVSKKSDFEELILKIGLSHLRAEARLPRPHRNPGEIQETWGIVKRLIVRYRLSDEFKGNNELKSKLRFFIFGKF